MVIIYNMKSYLPEYIVLFFYLKISPSKFNEECIYAHAMPFGIFPSTYNC